VVGPEMNIKKTKRMLLSHHQKANKNQGIKIANTIVLPVVLYGCETWSLTLKEKHGLRVFENSMLKRIFGVNRDEVTGWQTKLHNELRDLYLHQI
jgi:hypothetical protein